MAEEAGTGVTGWFADPNNQKLLAGIGGALAAPYAKSNPGLLAGSQLANSLITSRAAQTAAGSQTNKMADWQKQLAGILTPPGVEGPTSAKVNKDGSVDLGGINSPPGEGWQPKPEGGFSGSTGQNPSYPPESTLSPAPTGQQSTQPSPVSSPTGSMTGSKVSGRLTRAQQLSSLVPFY